VQPHPIDIGAPDPLGQVVLKRHYGFTWVIDLDQHFEHSLAQKNRYEVTCGTKAWGMLIALQK
jgi:hypothetical protein